MHVALQHLPIVSSATLLFTLMICFILTYALHHEAAIKEEQEHVKWLAKVLFTGKFFPESIIFSVGMTVAGLFYLLISFVRYFQMERIFIYMEEQSLLLLKCINRMRCLNAIACIAGTLGSLTFCSFVFRQYIPETYVDILIYISFFFFITHMLATTGISHRMKRRSSFLNRLALACFALICLIINIGLSIAPPMCRGLEILSAACQYGMFLALMLFTGLYYYSFTSLSFLLLDKRSSYV